MINIFYIACWTSYSSSAVQVRLAMMFRGLRGCTHTRCQPSSVLKFPPPPPPICFINWNMALPNCAKCSQEWKDTASLLLWACLCVCYMCCAICCVCVRMKEYVHVWMNKIHSDSGGKSSGMNDWGEVRSLIFFVCLCLWVHIVGTIVSGKNCSFSWRITLRIQIWCVFVFCHLGIQSVDSAKQ